VHFILHMPHQCNGVREGLDFSGFQRGHVGTVHQHVAGAHKKDRECTCKRDTEQGRQKGRDGILLERSNMTATCTVLLDNAIHSQTRSLLQDPNMGSKSPLENAAIVISLDISL